MDTKERHVRENESLEKKAERLENEKGVNDDLVAEKLRADGRVRKNESTRKVNRLWLWFGVLVLIAILLYWLFSIGIMEDLLNYING